MPERLRADARSNRDQILVAALDVFRERGTEVPMKDIADRAGVGVGTLYRRFPDRDALIVGAARAHLERLADLAETAAREEPTAWAALRRFLGECVDIRLGALAAAIEPAVHAEIKADPRLFEVRDAIIESLARLTAQAQSDGDLRTDIGPEDIAMLMTVQVYVRPGAPYSEAAQRVLALALDGLRPQR